MANNTDDNLYQIPFLTGNSTFLDWVNHYNTELVNKSNNLKIYDGLSGDGIVFTLGTTAADDPLGGATSGGDLPAGTMRCSLAEVIPNGTTFAGDVTINGTLNYDLTKNVLSAIKVRVNPAGGYTATRGFTFGMPIRVAGDKGDGCTGGPNYFLARADNRDYAEVLGVVSGVTWPVDSSGDAEGPFNDSDTYVEVTTAGRIQGDFSRANDHSSGLTAGQVYFLSPGNSGGLTRIEPSLSGQVSKPMILGVTSDVGFVMQYRGQFIQGSGTGGTGGIDQNRFFTAVDNASLITKGDIVAHVPGEGPNSDGWVTLNEDRWQHMSNAVGVCVTPPFTLDSQKYIEVVTTGYLDADEDIFPSTGLLYVNSTGKLSEIYPGGYAKPFAIAWSSGGSGTGTKRGTIINQNHNVGVGAGGANTASGTRSADPGNWAYASTSSGGATYGSAVNPNILINGGFDIWQRGIGVDGAFGATGSKYFADKWLRMDGVSGNGTSTGTYSIERKTFDTNQDEVFGNPKYYARLQNNLTVLGGSNGDFVHIENRIEDVRTLRGEDATLSFWAKCGVTGSVMGIVINQYDGTSTRVNRPASVSLGTIWNKYEVAFNVPDITSTPSGEHYISIAFDTTSLQTTLDIAKVKLERGIVATVNDEPNERTMIDELNRCSRYYQRSYDIDIISSSQTMSDKNTPDPTVLDFVTSPSKDYNYKFPIPMMNAPDLTFYSPSTGVTGDAYNRTSGRDLRKGSGTYGWNNASRICTSSQQQPMNTETITKNGMVVFVSCGSVVFDNISFHYVADADLNSNIVNPN
mgnify:FL=1